MRGGGQIYAPGAVVPGPHNMIPYPAYGHAYGQMPVGGPPPGSPDSFTTARSHDSFVTAEGSPQSRSSTRSRTRSRSRTLSRSSRSPPSPGAPGMFPGANSGYYPEAIQGPQGAEPPAGADSGYYPENQGYFYQNLRIRKSKKVKGKKGKGKGTKGKGTKGKGTKGFKGTKGIKGFKGTKGFKGKGTKGKRIKLKKV